MDQLDRMLRMADEDYEVSVSILRKQFEVDLKSIARARDLKKKNLREKAEAEAKVRSSRMKSQQANRAAFLADQAKRRGMVNVVIPPLGKNLNPNVRAFATSFVVDLISASTNMARQTLETQRRIEEVKAMSSAITAHVTSQTLGGINEVIDGATPSLKDEKLIQNRIKAQARVKEHVLLQKKMQLEKEKEDEKKRIVDETRRKAKSLALALREKEEKEKEERIALRAAKLETAKAEKKMNASLKASSKSPEMRTNINYLAPMSFAAESVLSPKAVEVLSQTMYPAAPSSSSGNSPSAEPITTLLIVGARSKSELGESGGSESLVRKKAAEIPKSEDLVWILQEDGNGAIIGSNVVPVSEEGRGARVKKRKEEEELHQLREDAFFHGGLDRYRASRAVALEKLGNRSLSPVHHSRAASPERGLERSGKAALTKESQPRPQLDVMPPRTEKAVTHLIMKIKKRMNPSRGKKVVLNSTENKLAHSPFARAFKGKYAELDAPLVIGGMKTKKKKKPKVTKEQEDQERKMNPLPSPGSLLISRGDDGEP